MKFDDDIKSASQLLETYFSGLLTGKMQEFSALDTGWQKVLKSIPYDGEKLAAHSEIVEVKNGYVHVKTDHSGWIQLMQLHKKKILIALKKDFPTMDFNKFVFTVRENDEKSK